LPAEPTRLVLATRNAHKVEELSRILASVGFRDGLAGLGLFPDAPEVPETGLTFADNALLKARAIAACTGLPAVADDSGLCVDALHGMPGVFSARWSGRHGDDRANLELVLGQLADVSERGAQFVCAAALVLPPPASDMSDISRQRREWAVTGVLVGSLTRKPRGSGGFGYDPIFLPEGSTLTTAELAPEEKDAISHRGHAFRALAPIIAANLCSGLPLLGQRKPGTKGESRRNQPALLRALAGSVTVSLADGTEMVVGWLMLVTVTAIVSVSALPFSVRTSFLTWCWPSIQTWNLAPVMPTFCISWPTGPRRSAGSLASAADVV
jgi:XTP/dITP diphosphohydrolase